MTKTVVDRSSVEYFSQKNLSRCCQNIKEALYYRQLSFPEGAPGDPCCCCCCAFAAMLSLTAAHAQQSSSLRENELPQGAAAGATSELPQGAAAGATSELPQGAADGATSDV
ncbi:MAG: hypothetical protein FWD31_02715 [Planctomycetaceae bacterium]|nr:hypothetical protein [Planctomycetaceae bacterium]